MSKVVTRRAIMQGGLAAGGAMVAHPLLARVGAAGPILGTPEQLAAERLLLALIADPEIAAIQRELGATLRSAPPAQSATGAARLDNAITSWTNSLIFKVLVAQSPNATFLWGTDDTPRTWFGHTVPGVGTSGDNPDNIYRSAIVAGDGRYEITGRFDPAHRPAQFTIEIIGGDPLAFTFKPKDGKSPDMGDQIAIFTDRNLPIGADGTFRLTLAPAASAAKGDIQLPPGITSIGIRDSRSDWTQRPARLGIRRLDRPTSPAGFDPARVKAATLAKLREYVTFWADFPNKWLGGLQPNAHSPARPRDGGWGFVAGFRFRLAPEEAIVLRIGRGDAPYTGVQLIDPWMIAPDSRKHQSSLNLSQSVTSSDGSLTYVVAGRDPGVANWIDTTGWQDGYGILRWQGTPAGTAADALFPEFRVVNLSQIAALKDLPRLSPILRRRQLADRAKTYETRLL